MAAILLGANATAAEQIASKRYVDTLGTSINTTLADYSTTTQMTNAITNAITDNNTTVVGAALDGKANLEAAGTAGYVATVDAAGQYVRSGSLLSDMATTTNVNSIVEGAVNTAVQNINAEIDDMLTATDAAELYETKTNVSDGLALKADKTQVGTDALTTTATTITGAVNELKDAADTNATDISNLSTTVSTMNTDISDDLALKEDAANKTTTMFGVDVAGSTTKFTTVSAVEGYAVPKPTANCLGEQSHCVLAIDKSNGSIYWEDVAVPVELP